MWWLWSAPATGGLLPGGDGQDCAALWVQVLKVFWRLNGACGSGDPSERLREGKARGGCNAAAGSAPRWQRQTCLNRPRGIAGSERGSAGGSWCRDDGEGQEKPGACPAELVPAGKAPESPGNERGPGGQGWLEQPLPFPQTRVENLVCIYVTVQNLSKEGNLGCLCVLLGHVLHSFPFTSLPKPARLMLPRWCRALHWHLGEHRCRGDLQPCVKRSGTEPPEGR